MVATATKVAEGLSEVSVKKLTATQERDLSGKFQDRISNLERELNSVFFEREDLIRGLLTMLVGKFNLYAGGPPGTGKTELSKALANAFDISRYYYLVGAQTEPGHLLGPVDLKAMMENHEFKLKLEGMMADSDLCILDEGFKGNAPTLNALLGLILDHGIQNGRDWFDSPLMSVVVCSNELPQTDKLAAFWDRLALRYWVDDISWGNREILSNRRAGNEPTPLIKTKFSRAELLTMQRLAIRTKMPKEMVKLAVQVQKDVHDKGIITSTRKSNQIIDIIKVYAWICGCEEVQDEHIEILKYVLWNELRHNDDINPVIDKILSEALKLIDEIWEVAQKVARSSINYPVQDAAKRKAYFLGTDTQLVGMIEKLERIVKNSPTSKRGKKAAKIVKDIGVLRSRNILPVLASLELS